MKFEIKKGHKERIKATQKEIRRKRGSEIYGSRDRAVDQAHQRMVNSNGYGY